MVVIAAPQAVVPAYEQPPQWHCLNNKAISRSYLREYTNLKKKKVGHTDVYVRDIVRAAAIEGTRGCQCLNSLPVHLDPPAAVPAPGLVPLQRGAGNIVIGVVGTLFQVSTSLGNVGWLVKGRYHMRKFLALFHLQRSSILWSIVISLRHLPAISPAR